MIIDTFDLTVAPSNATASVRIAKLPFRHQVMVQLCDVPLLSAGSCNPSIVILLDYDRVAGVLAVNSRRHIPAIIVAFQEIAGFAELKKMPRSAVIRR